MIGQEYSRLPLEREYENWLRRQKDEMKEKSGVKKELEKKEKKVTYGMKKKK